MRLFVDMYIPVDGKEITTLYFPYAGTAIVGAIT